MRLVVTLGEVELEFLEPGTDGAYPWLVKVGSLLLSAVAGHLEGLGVDEAPNVDLALDNAGKQATRLLGFCLRAPATLYGDDGSEFFSGLVGPTTYGATLAITLEA